MVCVTGIKSIFMRWQKHDTVPINICCVGWWIQKTTEDKTIYYVHNRLRRKKTERLLPSNLFLQLHWKLHISGTTSLCTGMYHPVHWLSGQSFQLFTFCSFHLHLCSSVWLTEPEESLNTNPASGGSCFVLLWCSNLLWPEFCYFKDNQQSSSCYCLVI